MLSRLISRVPRRQFSKYIEDNYGKEVHRLANRPGIEVSPIEVFVYACGSFLLVADVSYHMIKASWTYFLGHFSVTPVMTDL